MNCCNKTSDVELSVYDFFGIWTVLDVPYVNPDDGHVGFWRYLNDLRFVCKNNVIEQVIVLKDIFDVVWWNLTIGLLTNIWNFYNLEVEFRLQKSGWWNLICIRNEWVFNIFFYLLKIRAQRDIVSCDNNPFVLYTNKVNHHTGFDGFESTVYIDDMQAWVFDELFGKISVHRNNYLLSWRTFGSHVNLGFRLVFRTIDDFLHFFNFLIWEIGECLLDF